MSTGVESLLVDSADVIRAPVVLNEYGQEVRDWDNPTLVGVVSCSIQPASYNENTEDRQTTTDEWMLYSSDSVAYGILAPDRIVWRGQTLEVASDVQLWRFGDGSPATDHHVELRLKLVTG